MAKKRMFTMEVVDTDAFMDMPQSSQLLYFHLAMRADDDGFVCNPKKVMRMIGSVDDDIKVLLGKRFILGFESGIVVIKHWRMHNLLRKDRYTETTYKKEKELLALNENNAYTETKELKEGNKTATKRQPNGTTGKVRLGKVRLGKERENALTPAKQAKLLFSNDENYVKGVLSWLADKGVPEKIAQSELNKFVSYWTEKNQSGTKERWELQKTFEVNRRLATWFSRVKEFQGRSRGKEIII